MALTPAPNITMKKMPPKCTNNVCMWRGNFIVVSTKIDRSGDLGISVT